MKNNIIVLGSRGMLGQMVTQYFTKKDYNVICVNDRFTEENINEFIDNINKYEDSIVINCIGKIKQKTSNSLDLLWSNTVLPLKLSQSLKKTHRLIHPSTDCVFDGLSKRGYAVNHIHTAKDIYGVSKSLGEQALHSRGNTLIVRVSIIGPDNNSSKGLFSWFMSQENTATLNGFTNHYWNGITTLEWCNTIFNYLFTEFKSDQCKVIQLGTSKIYTKYEMLCLFNKIFEKGTTINKMKHNYINRTLIPDLANKSLNEQLVELKHYLEK